MSPGGSSVTQSGTFRFLVVVGAVMLVVLLISTSNLTSLTIQGPVEVYEYIIDADEAKRGAVLKVPLGSWAKLHMHHMPQFRSERNLTPEKFVFATAASSNHFLEGLDALASVQNHFPQHWIIYYDLGLTIRQKIQIQSVCSVIYRRFHFEDYPAHVKRLNNYAWKPILIADLLHEFGGVLWMDSSIRFNSSDLSPLFSLAQKNDGFVITANSGASTWTVTNPVTYKYIPALDNEKLKTTEMYEATIMLLYNTQHVHDYIIEPVVACCLVNDCINHPSYKLSCNFKFDDKRIGKDSPYAGCHRYDQSLINIVVANLFKFNVTKFQFNQRNLYAIRRESLGVIIPKYC